MPRNGSGLYVLPAGNPVATQTLITSAWANATMNDLAFAISQSLSKDGQTTPTNNLPMGGFRLTGLGDPANRADAAPLGFVQDGSAIRLSSVAGTDSITAVPPGAGGFALVTGMTLQLIPANTNTGPVTINVGSTGAKDVLTQGGSKLGKGNLKTGKPYAITYDGAAFRVTAGDLGYFAQGSVSGWDRPESGTYPLLGIVDVSTISIPAGNGRIVMPGAKDASGVLEVSWPAQNVGLSYLGSAWSTHIGINASGNVVQFSGAFQPTYARDNIMLGTAVHVDGTVTSVVTRPTIYGDMSYAAYDVASILQNTILTGGRISANGTNPYQINIESGTLFSIGSDPNEINSPNIDEFAPRTSPQFYPITGTSGSRPATANVPVTFYDPAGAGVPTSIPGTTTAVIHRLYQLSGQLLLLYGQNTYTGLADATTKIQVDTSNTILPAKLADATLLGYIIVQKDCTNLNDTSKALLVSRGSSEFSVGGGGSSADAPVDGFYYGRKNGNWSKVQRYLSDSAGTKRMVPALTGTSLRWEWGANATAESGSNAGSDWRLIGYDDSATVIGTALGFSRATLDATFGGGVKSKKSSTPFFDLESTGNAADKKLGRIYMAGTGELVISLLSDAGVAQHSLSIDRDGALTFDAGNVWHQGNFDPATKLGVSATAASATKLATARLIGGVAFDGTANINLPGVNTAGNQNTTGSAAKLTTPRNINGTTFDGSGAITTALWGTARTVTLGGTAKSVDGSTNFGWTLAEMGAVENAGGVAKIVKLTQAAYDALGTKDSATLYVIVG